MGARAASMPKLATAPSLLAPFWLGRLDDRRLAAARRGGRRARLRGPLRPSPPRAAGLLPAHAAAPARRPRTRCSRRSCARTARWSRTGAPTDLRPWLFTIARNHCLTLLARPPPDARRSTTTLREHATGLGEQVQVRADLRAVVADVERLPDDQRAALVLAELADLSHDQIGEVIGVRPGKVKALIHQARTTLIAERDARETPCEAIREQLATARGGALRRGPLRRHLRVCAPCRAYRDAVAEQRRALALALPGDAEPRAQGGHPRRGVGGRRRGRGGGRRREHGRVAGRRPRGEGRRRRARRRRRRRRGRRDRRARGSRAARGAVP